ncbi:MAG: ribosome assembly factor SBDS [Nanoarchaeota archaeon]
MNTIARIKQAGKHFEIIVDLDNALNFKKGTSSFIEAEGHRIFTDSKKGNAAAHAELQTAFGTTDIDEITKKIVKSGEILVTQEHRDEEKDKKIKQVIDFLARNAFDPQTGRPHTPERIKSALEQAHVHIKDGSIDKQIPEIIAHLSKILPIKIETKRVKIEIPAIHTGKAYGVVAQYKQNEKWKDDGSLEVIVEVPAGMIIDFYDKLNAVTHGSALTEEIKD